MRQLFLSRHIARDSDQRAHLVASPLSLLRMSLMCRRWTSPLVRCLLVFDPYGSSHRILFSGLEKALPRIQLLRQQPDIPLVWQGVDRTTPNAHSLTVNNVPSSLFWRTV